MGVILASESDLEIELLRGKLKDWKDVAAQIQDNKQLRAFIRAHKANVRHELYDCLKPHLKFKAKPFLLLK